MLSVCRRIDILDDITALLSEAPLSKALREARGVLVQVAWNRPCPKARARLRSEILRLAPCAVLVGASSAGQVAEGRLVPEGIVVSVTCFERSTVRLFCREAALDGEVEAGRALAELLASCVDLKAVLLLTALYAIDAAAVLRGLRECGPSGVLFGGVSVQGPEGDSGVFCGSEVSERTLVAVALCGPELRVETRVLFDWRPLGPAITLTEVERGCIRRIDGRPAYGYYEENLGIEDRADLYLLEFPLLIERAGTLLARNTLSVEADGGVGIAADAYSGEVARLGYLDMAARAESVDRAVRFLRDFRPEGIFLYSCACRLFTLQDEIESETLPFQGIAPTSGFFTAGEFYPSGDGTQLLNSSEVVVALREGPPSSALASAEPDGPSPFRASGLRHRRMTSRLFRFVGALSEKLEAVNGELSLRNAELAETNESLRAEVAVRKLAEGRAKAVSAEKETLLRELQHRVKNSLALISSIAGIEAMQSPAPEAKAALEKLESRIAALASLYDILYTTGDIEEIGLAEYLGQVVDYAAEGLGSDAKGIAIRHRVESVSIDVKRAISIGLVVNELVTDGIKYAFPEGRGGRIEVRLAREGGMLVLSVEDEGVGLPQGFDPSRSGGFGLTLVQSLAAQLDAEFSARSEGGAKFELRIPL